jgi:hypothetical protein
MLQTISVGSGTLSVGLGAANPASANIVAPAQSNTSPSAVEVGDFTFSAQNTPFTVTKLEVDVPLAVASAIGSLAVNYKDVNGAAQTVSMTPTSGSSTSTAAFTGLTYFVPQNDSSDLTVWVTPVSIASGGNISGTKIVVALPHGVNFQASDSSGNATTSPGAWTADVNSNSTAGYGTFVLRKSVPTFAMQSLGTNPVPAAGQALYRFTVSADPAGAVDIDQLAFKVSTTTATLSGFTLYDVTSGTATALNASAVNTVSNGNVAILFDTLQQVGAGSSKTFELRAATLGNWTSGAAISVSLAQDTAYVANAAAGSLTATNNVVWSDRSATNHASAGLTATDWTNGYLLKDFVNDITSFTHS